MEKEEYEDSLNIESWNQIYSGVPLPGDLCQPYSKFGYTEYLYDMVGSLEGRVLDAGCGTLGGIESLLKKHKPTQSVQLTAVDFSQNALKRAGERKYFIESNYPVKVELLQRNLKDLQLPSNTFDEVISIETIEHLGSKFEVGLGEFKRVCKPNKDIFLTFLHKDYLKPQDVSKVPAWKVPVIEDNIAKYIGGCESAVFTESDVEGMMGQFNLEPVNISTLTTGELRINTNEFNEKVDPNTKSTIFVKCKKQS